jgi:hypothetical protein
MGGGFAGHKKREFLYVMRREPTYVIYRRHFKQTPQTAADGCRRCPRGQRAPAPEVGG